MLSIIFLGKSAVTLTEDVYYEITKGNLPLRYRLAYKIFSNWAVLRATKIIAVSWSSKLAVAKAFNVNLDIIFVLPNAVSRPLTNEDQNEIGDYILHVGQAFPRRHLREEIAAFEKLAEEFKDLKFVVIGKDAYRPPIVKDLVQETNNRLGRSAIIYKEYVPQRKLDNLYFNAKILIYISENEAFGLPPLEALAHGVPAIVTDMPVTKEIFGDKAFFVKNPNSVPEIVSVVKQALTDNKKRQEILEVKDAILKRYTWSYHTDKFLELVRQVATL